MLVDDKTTRVVHTESLNGAVAGQEANAVTQYQTLFHGAVIGPRDEGYDQARTVFYGGFDRRPSLIIRAEDEGDVLHAIALARDGGMELAVRSGGHSLAGHGVSDGGIVLDLSRMRALQIDPEGRTAWAQTGLSAGEYTVATGAYGLATGFGDTGSVGIGGITLGGGIGYLVRKYGLTIDDLLAAEIATADGQLVHVDADTHPDLFWAIRGGGGNFGVATRFQFRLHDVGTVVGGMLVLPATPEVISSFVEAAEAAPEELSTIASVMKAPPMPFLPAEYHGKPVILATLVYAGEVEAGQKAVAPFRGLARPIADMVRPMRYPEIYPKEQPGFHPLAATRTMFVDQVDHRASGEILDCLRASNASMAAAQIRVLGGAMARVPVDATAFAHRSRRVMVNVAAMYARAEEAAVHEAWVTDLARALTRGDQDVYVNFLGREGKERVRNAYPGSTWDRLREIKSRYDPNNLFHLNQNIPPLAD